MFLERINDFIEPGRGLMPSNWHVSEEQDRGETNTGKQCCRKN